MKNPLETWEKHRADIPGRLTHLLRDMVWAQDRGYALGEELEKLRFGVSSIAQIGVMVDIERRRMLHEGIDVYAPPESPDQNFMIGLEPYPYKKS